MHSIEPHFTLKEKQKQHMPTPAIYMCIHKREFRLHRTVDSLEGLGDRAERANLFFIHEELYYNNINSFSLFCSVKDWIQGLIHSNTTIFTTMNSLLIARKKKSQRCLQTTPNSGELNRKTGKVLKCKIGTHRKILDHGSILLSYCQLLSFGAPAHWEDNAAN